MWQKVECVWGKTEREKEREKGRNGETDWETDRERNRMEKTERKKGNEIIYVEMEGKRISVKIAKTRRIAH